MKVLYLTGGSTGSGNTVIGISLGLGLRRLDAAVDFEMLSPSTTAESLCARVGIRHTVLPHENEKALGPGEFETSALFLALTRLRPDVLIVNKHWFLLYAMLPFLKCKKVFTSINLQHRIFTIPLEDQTLYFDPKAWDLCVALEPWNPPFPFYQIDPVIMRDREEILPRSQALTSLGVSGSKPVFLLALSASSEAFAEAKKAYAHMADEGWDCIITQDFRLFPIQDYYAAIDFMACGAGYNSLWESIYHGVKKVYIPQATRFENTDDRISRSADYTFKENGADTLARIIVNM